MINNIIKKINFWWVLLVGTVMLGVFLRIYGLGDSGIFFYDEALYLNHSLQAFDIIRAQHLAGFSDLWKAFFFYIHWPLNFTKPIWILIVDSRFLFTQWNDWDYAKFASCFFGVMTLPLLFFFARRFFNSLAIACLSVAILALLPGHVFYSRIGLQEAFSAFVVLAGFYVYMFPNRFGKNAFFAGLLLSMAYLANYRLIMLPGLLVVTELWFGLVAKQGVRWRHLVWTCVTFLAVMVVVGSLLGGTQIRYTFAWVFHQQDMAVSKRLWTEIFAYPYYLFRLENWVLAGAFFASIYFLVRRRWVMAWPFVVVCVQMLFFTTATDRGARYIAIVLPLMAMSSAALIYTVYQDVKHQAKVIVLVVVLFLMFSGMIWRSAELISDVSAYEPSVQYLLEKSTDVKFVTTQDLVQRLYVHDRGHVLPVPEDVFVLFQDYAKGYRYLILDPQGYISFTGNDYKWGLPLKGYVSFIERTVLPLKTFSHFNHAVMERVVFEHSDNLFQSIRYLNSPDLAKMSSLRVYDMTMVIRALSGVMGQAQHQKK
jgi:hypothetical protein